jgi:hypothetical protein
MRTSCRCLGTRWSTPSRRWWGHRFQSELHVRHPQINQGMRDQHPDGDARQVSCGLRQRIGKGCGQIRPLWVHTSRCLHGPSAAHPRVLYESRMPRRGYPNGAEVFPVHLQVIKAWIDPTYAPRYANPGQYTRRWLAALDVRCDRRAAIL